MTARFEFLGQAALLAQVPIALGHLVLEPAALGSLAVGRLVLEHHSLGNSLRLVCWDVTSLMD